MDRALGGFRGQEVYVHAEWIPGGFIRNARVRVLEAHLRGGEPYRVALRCAGDGWVRMEDVTHWTRDDAGRLGFAAFADVEERLRCTLELSLEPFPA